MTNDLAPSPADDTLHASECRFCRKPTIASISHVEPYDVMRCSSCGGEFLDPQPTDEVLSSIYTADYFFLRDSAEDVARYESLKARSALKSLKLLAQKKSPPGDLFEIGCGTGGFLVQAERLGFRVSGIDVSESAAQTATSRIAGTVSAGMLDDVDIPDGAFDVVAANDVIEHVRDPIAFASRIRRLLRPGGAFLIVTPSLHSWSRRLMGRKWFEYKVEHLHYFGRLSIASVLREAGFGDFRYASNIKSFNLDYVAAHFERYPIAGWSPAVRAVRSIVPDSLAHVPFDTAASGMTVVAS
jgi:SAM-dependent methyltransferase